MTRRAALRTELLGVPSQRGARDRGGAQGIYQDSSSTRWRRENEAMKRYATWILAGLVVLLAVVLTACSSS